MREAEFVAWAEQAYGRYMPAMKFEVLAWLKPHDGYFIAALREVSLREQPTTYGKPPGVHELDSWKIEAYERGHTLEAIDNAGKFKQIAADPEIPVTPEMQRRATEWLEGFHKRMASRRAGR